MILRGTHLYKIKEELKLNEESFSCDNDSYEFYLPKERILHGIPHVTSSDTFTRNDWLDMMKIAQILN